MRIDEQLNHKAYQLARTEDLVFAPFNPTKRTELSNLSTLIESIAAIGVITPLAVDPHNVVADGNRRLAAARFLGLGVVPMVRTPLAAVDFQRVHEGAVRKRSGNEALDAFLLDPRVLSDKSRKLHECARRMVGTNLLRDLQIWGGSIATYNQAMRVVRYCAREETSENVQMCLQWIMKHKMTLLARLWVSDWHKSPLKLWGHIVGDKPLPPLRKRHLEDD